MPKDVTPGKPTTRQYSPEEKAAAVSLVDRRLHRLEHYQPGVEAVR